MVFRVTESRLFASMRSLRDTRKLVYCAMLLAVQVVLGQLSSVQLGTAIRVSFGYLAVSATAVLLGPFPAMASAALADVLGYILKPVGEYFPGFTLSAALGGLIYGLMFFERKITIPRVLIAKLAINLVVNLLLNTLWLNLLYGDAFFAILPARALKNLIQYPVDVCLLYPVVLWCSKTKSKLRL